MVTRCVHVLHVLAAQDSNGRRRFLLYPHDRWASPESHRPLLALPAKKVVPVNHPLLAGDDPHERALAALLREDLGVAAVPEGGRRFPPATVELLSPTRRQRTRYTLWPVLVPAADGPDAAFRHEGGRWLTAREALRHSDLSPTARCLLERADLLARDAETELFLRARGGDRRVLGTLFEQTRPWLTARLRACPQTRGLFEVPEDVEDALQDAAANALAHLHGFDPCRGTVGAWLWIITRNCAISILRRRTVRRAASLFHDDGSLRDVLASGPGPAALVESREELRVARRRLARALAAADAEARQAWEMRSVRGMPYAAIAEELGRPVGTIATWIFRLKAAIQAGGRD